MGDGDTRVLVESNAIVREQAARIEELQTAVEFQAALALKFQAALEGLAKEVRFSNDYKAEGPEPNMGSGEPDTCVFCPSHIGTDGYETEQGRHIAHQSWCPTLVARKALGRDPEDTGG